MKDVEDFLGLLKYERIPHDKIDRELKTKSFFHFNEADYLSFSGVTAQVFFRSTDDDQKVSLHTQIWASKYDVYYLNHTIKELRKYFGGHFISDFGKNKFIKFDGQIRINAEAGCFLAYQKFISNINTVQYLVENLDQKRFDFPKTPKLKIFDLLKEFDPNIVAVNLIIPFLVAILEEYFRSTYVALLKYSPNKLNLLKKSSIGKEDIEKLLINDTTFEIAASRWLNFQALDKINNHFRSLDAKLDIFGKLKKTKKGGESNFNTLNRLIKLRHSIIHKSILDIEYNTKKCIKDIELITFSIKLIYEEMVTFFKWGNSSS